ncbi:MAG: clostripain-related cysteine peptidase, partial [candidate division WOR-3 bacterium]
VGIYMCADNGMNDQAYADLAEMMRIGSSSEVNVVVQVDNAARDSHPTCRRYLVTKNRLVLQSDLGEVDMADTLVLSGFMEFMKRRFPARRYGLVLWDHGNGWYRGEVQAGSVFFDESHGGVMGVAGGELAAALRRGEKLLGQRLTFLGFDACLMQMAEVAAECAPYCEYMLGSEGLVPWGGFDYTELIGSLVARPTATPDEFLPEMCAAYVAAYPDEDVCLSALEMRKLDRLLPVLRSTVADSVDPAGADLRRARDEVQTFALNPNRPPCTADDHVDLVHLFALLPGGRTGSLRQTLNGFVTANRSSGSGYAAARGVAVWFPSTYLEFKARAGEYRRLTWADSSGWLRFLNRYYGADDVKPEQPVLTGTAAGRRGDARLSWSRSYDIAPVTYRLYEGTEPRDALVDYCDSLGRWSAVGWTVSTQNARSQPGSFFSGSGSNLDNQLVLVNGLNLPGGGLLSFYTLLNTEEREDSLGELRRDVCYVEWSSDRVNWQALDSLYGQEAAWSERRYLLPAGPAVWLRLRYVTNEAVNEPGVFVDDIRVQAFERFRLAAGPIPDTTALVFNLSMDTAGYYYCVTATDSFGNVSMASQLLRLRVETWAEPYTLPAPFSGPCRLRIDYPPDERPDVRIYTLSGTLVKEFADVSVRELEWDGKNEQGRVLADGVYVVAVQGAHFRKLGKIAKVSR